MDRLRMEWIARAHTKEMERRFGTQILESVQNTTEYYRPFSFVRDERYKTEIKLVDADSVTAIERFHDGRTAVLNFASYKNPGGGFMSGMMAQEESLCHYSFLYNVLKEWGDYYWYNKSNLNGGFYTDRALYSPDIVFIPASGEEIECDVITCAAPNATRMIRYKTGEEEKNSNALRSRIKYVLSIAADKRVDTLILGAYGCGVFKQNPVEVATYFKEFLKEYDGLFKTVIFAIPNATGENYKAFERVLLQ